MPNLSHLFLDSNNITKLIIKRSIKNIKINIKMSNFFIYKLLNIRLIDKFNDVKGMKICENRIRC